MKLFRTIAAALAAVLIVSVSGCPTDSPAASELTAIAVSVLPTKKVYNLGDAFDPAGLEVTGTYGDGTEKPVTGYTLSPVDTSTAGTKTVTVTLEDVTTEFTVRVRQANVALVSIKVTALPDKTHYAVGETFDPTGLEVTGTWSDETEEAVTDYTLSEVDTSADGPRTVTVTLGDLTTTFTVTVGEAVLTSIAVTSTPKTVYRTGEPFNPEGLAVAKVWSDGKKEAVTDYTLGAIDTAQAGEKTVEITWGDFTTRLSVFVSGGELLSIAVSREPDRGQNWGGALDLTGLEVTGNFSDFPDTPIPITVGTSNVSGYDPTLLPGERALTITVEGKKASFTIQVSALFFGYGKPRAKGEVVNDSYSVPVGRTLVLAPVRWGIGANAVYEWKVDGIVQPGAVTECFSFKPKTQKEYVVSVSARDGKAYAETSTKVRCVARPGTYKRARTAQSKAYTTDLFGFYPAPGYAGGTRTQTWEELQKIGLKSWTFGLGGFGGSVVYGFDHSVENKPGQYSLTIPGNSFAGWGEPGVVWVMQDENGNGQPDDTWYELAGSEFGKPSETRRYAAAYTTQEVYIDNTGASEAWKYGSYLTTEYFTWSSEPGNYVIFSGTKLQENSYTEGGILYHPGPAWGYADSDKYFRISDAIQADGSPANLDYIDFVRVQSACLFDTKVVSEVTTECGMGFDYEMYH
jgi:hypothetical protein